jgi:DNA-binding MarR family transcriptional regulator
MGEPDDVLEAVHRVMHLYRSQRHRLLGESEHGLTHMEGKALGYFARHPGATLSELAAHAGRDKGQLARLVSGLRERGLLEARVDEVDRRHQRLHLTQGAEESLQAMRREGRKISAAAVRGLGEDEKQQLLALLAQVQANLEGMGPG